MPRIPCGSGALCVREGSSLLQTRREALAGSRTGLLATSLQFGLMHLPSHGEGTLRTGAAQVIALQRTTGIAPGVL